MFSCNHCKLMCSSIKELLLHTPIHRRSETPVETPMHRIHSKDSGIHKNKIVDDKKVSEISSAWSNIDLFNGSGKSITSSGDDGGIGTSKSTNVNIQPKSNSGKDSISSYVNILPKCSANDGSVSSTADISTHHQQAAEINMASVSIAPAGRQVRHAIATLDPNHIIQLQEITLVKQIPILNKDGVRHMSTDYINFSGDSYQLIYEQLQNNCRPREVNVAHVLYNVPIFVKVQQSPPTAPHETPILELDEVLRTAQVDSETETETETEVEIERASNTVNYDEIREVAMEVNIPPTSSSTLFSPLLRDVDLETEYEDISSVIPKPASPSFSEIDIIGDSPSNRSDFEVEINDDSPLPSECELDIIGISSPPFESRSIEYPSPPPQLKIKPSTDYASTPLIEILEADDGCLELQNYNVDTYEDDTEDDVASSSCDSPLVSCEKKNLLCGKVSLLELSTKNDNKVVYSVNIKVIHYIYYTGNSPCYI